MFSRGKLPDEDNIDDSESEKAEKRVIADSKVGGDVLGLGAKSKKRAHSLSGSEDDSSGSFDDSEEIDSEIRTESDKEEEEEEDLIEESSSDEDIVPSQVLNEKSTAFEAATHKLSSFNEAYLWCTQIVRGAVLTGIERDEWSTSSDESSSLSDDELNDDSDDSAKIRAQQIKRLKQDMDAVKSAFSTAASMLNPRAFCGRLMLDPDSPDVLRTLVRMREALPIMEALVRVQQCCGRQENGALLDDVTDEDSNNEASRLRRANDTSIPIDMLNFSTALTPQCQKCDLLPAHDLLDAAHHPWVVVAACVGKFFEAALKGPRLARGPLVPNAVVGAPEVRQPPRDVSTVRDHLFQCENCTANAEKRVSRGERRLGGNAAASAATVWGRSRNRVEAVERRRRRKEKRRKKKRRKKTHHSSSDESSGFNSSDLEEESEEEEEGAALPP